MADPTNIVLIDELGNDLNPYVKPATASTLGTIKVGSNLSITADGVLSATGSGGAGAGYSESCPALTVSDGKLTWVVTHGLGTQNVIANLYTSSGNELMKDVTVNSTSQITVTFSASSNASAGDYKIVILSLSAFEAGDSLPSQTGHSGDLLTTDGTDASWVDTAEVYPVVETYYNNGSWYRIYAADSTGYQWCEQGGTIPPQSGTTISYLKQFINTNYQMILTPHGNTSNNITYAYLGYDKTESGFTIPSNTVPVDWMACGYIEVE